MQEEIIDHSKTEAGKRRLLYIFAGMATVLLVALLLYYVNCVRPLDEFRALVESGDYKTAYSFYEEQLTSFGGNDRKAQEILAEQLQELWRQYRESDVSFEPLSACMDACASYPEAAGELAAIQDSIDALHASRSSYAQGESLMEEGRYLEAYQAFSAVSQSDILYEDSQLLSQTAAESHCSVVVEEARALALDGQYEEAMSRLDEALVLFPDNAALTGGREEVYLSYREYTRQTRLAQAQELLNSQNLQDALYILSGLREEFPDDEQTEALWTQYEDAYAASVLQAAQPLYDAKDYSGALALLSPAAELLPGREDIRTLFQEADKRVPKWLADFPCENVSLRGTRKTEESAADMQGNVYQHVILYVEPSALSMQTMQYSEGMETYDLGRNYTRLFATLAIKNDSRGIRGEQTGTFRIYGDGRLLLEQAGISEASDPLSIDLDITGVDELTFSFTSGTGLKYLLGNACVYGVYEEPAPQEQEAQ